MVCRTRPGEDLSLGFCLPRTPANAGSPDRIPAASCYAHIQHLTRPPQLTGTVPPQGHALLPPLRLSAGSLPGLPLLRWPPAPAAVTVRVTGSRMWQFLTGKPYTSAHSDLDLVVDLPHAGLLDEAAAFLTLAQERIPWRLDGELSVAGRGEVHWREWLSPVEQVLVKSLHSVELRDRAWIRACVSP